LSGCSLSKICKTRNVIIPLGFFPLVVLACSSLSDGVSEENVVGRFG
jgi:hypothetical protein